MAYLHRLFSGVTPVQPQLSAASLCPFWVTSGQSPAKPATPGDALVGCTVHIGSLKYAHHFGVDCFATLTEHSSTRFGSVSKEPRSGLRKPGLPSCVLHETRNALQPKSNRETFPKTKFARSLLVSAKQTSQWPLPVEMQLGVLYYLFLVGLLANGV